MDNEKHHRLTELVLDAIGHTVAGDASRGADTLIEIGSQCNDHEMYGVCCAFAAAGVKVIEKLYGGRFDPTAGDMLALQELVPGAAETDPAKTFALRFLVAYGNNDTALALALYNAASKATNDEYVDSVSALLVAVAGLARLALDQLPA